MTSTDDNTPRRDPCPKCGMLLAPGEGHDCPEASAPYHHEVKRGNVEVHADRSLPPHPDQPSVFGPFNSPSKAPPLCEVLGCVHLRGHLNAHHDHRGQVMDAQGKYYDIPLSPSVQVMEKAAATLTPGVDPSVLTAPEPPSVSHPVHGPACSCQACVSCRPRLNMPMPVMTSIMAPTSMRDRPLTPPRVPVITEVPAGLIPVKMGGKVFMGRINPNDGTVDIVSEEGK